MQSRESIINYLPSRGRSKNKILCEEFEDMKFSKAAADSIQIKD